MNEIVLSWGSVYFVLKQWFLWKEGDSHIAQVNWIILKTVDLWEWLGLSIESSIHQIFLLIVDFKSSERHKKSGRILWVFFLSKWELRTAKTARNTSNWDHCLKVLLLFLEPISRCRSSRHEYRTWFVNHIWGKMKFKFLDLELHSFHIRKITGITDRRKCYFLLIRVLDA